ncbi:MAG: GNAT family N-acetyltransferase [Chloroflexota bacterium]|nr:GNAT family N-acetyltransferase [Chloroflexota bacterium]
MPLSVRDLEAADLEWADRLISRHQGSRMVARLGELIDPLTLPGIVAELDGRPVALITCSETERGFEVLTLHSEVERVGAGTLLLETALRVASASGCKRLWLVTTNDNLGALRFYLHRGMRIAAVHQNAVTKDRALKPEIAVTNPENGMPIRDLVELELWTDDGEKLRLRRFPLVEDLDALPEEAAIDFLQTIFEGGPQFLRGLARARPFETDDGLLSAAHELGRSLDTDAQIELLDAHPRIGADPAAVSALSRAEQGSDRADGAGEDPEPWVAEELEALNEAYERIFGFRFVVFVAGRPQREILAILERALRDYREPELRRGVDDIVFIAADRLARLREIP